jgi:hypothetical protein
MKRLSYLTRLALFVIGMLAASWGYASEGGREELALNREVHNRVGLPPAKLQISRQAIATVQFSVNAEGRMQLRSVQSATPALATYVRTRLQDAVLTDAEPYVGKNYRLLVKVADLR